ncbi:MAG: glycosyltransferase 87 family protein [Azospirillaceae bacterium]|nr:glycosyltransferase 87 family protein [Azospirillaceae bacterium]
MTPLSLSFITCPTLNRRAAWRTLEQIAWTLWITTLVGLTAKVLVHPTSSVTHVYRQATLTWWSGHNIYGPGIHGFLYLPSSAVLFTPFALPPLWFGDILWRLVQVGLFTLALVRLAPLFLPAAPRGALAWALLLALPAATVNIMRSQSEIILAALMMLTAVAMADRRWRHAAAWLALATAIKPLALVMVLVCVVVYPMMRSRLALGLAFVLLLPFFNPDPGYVAGQYLSMVHKLTVAAEPGIGRWNEITMMLDRFGLGISENAATALRFATALATLALCVAATRRLRPIDAALVILAACECYLLDFNPRTELGSYMNLAALLGLFAGARWWYDHRDRAGWIAAGLALALGTHMYGDWIYRPTDVWLKPLVALIVLFILGFIVVRRFPVTMAVPRLRSASRDPVTTIAS